MYFFCVFFGKRPSKIFFIALLLLFGGKFGTPVQKTTNFRPLTLVFQYRRKDFRNNFSVIDPYLKILIFRSKLFHYFVRKRNYFNFRLNSRDSHKVAVQLPMFSLPSALGAFVSETIWNGIPAEREFQRFSFRRNHPGKAGCHLGPKRHLSTAAIGEGKHLLIDNFIASFSTV